MVPSCSGGMCPLPRQGRRVWKSTVVVTTPELCIRPEVKSVLGRKCHWDVLVVDEAHRLKNDGSKLNVRTCPWGVALWGDGFQAVPCSVLLCPCRAVSWLPRCRLSSASRPPPRICLKPLRYEGKHSRSLVFPTVVPCRWQSCSF